MRYAGLLFVYLLNPTKLSSLEDSNMPPLHPRLPTFCSFLYSPRRTQPSLLLALLKLQRSQPRNYAAKSLQGQRQAKLGSSQVRNDVGLLPGSYP